MRRAFLSFAVITFVAVVLYFFIASEISLEEYQQAGQKRLQAQMLSQRYQDTVPILNSTVMDAITDSAYNSKYATGCNVNPTASTFRDALSARMGGYLQNTTNNLSTDSILLNYDWNSTASSPGDKGRFWLITSTENPTSLTFDFPGAAAPCPTSALTMNRIITEVTFRLSLTSTDGVSGYFNRPFDYRYETLVSCNAGTLYVVISNSTRPDLPVKCVKVVP